MKKFDIYQTITARIIEQLEQGLIPWTKPWNGVRSGAFNRISKQPYSLLNQMLLSKSGEYATFAQWKKLGGYVRKGEAAMFARVKRLKLSCIGTSLRKKKQTARAKKKL